MGELFVTNFHFIFSLGNIDCTAGVSNIFLFFCFTSVEKDEQKEGEKKKTKGREKEEEKRRGRGAFVENRRTN